VSLHRKKKFLNFEICVASTNSLLNKLLFDRFIGAKKFFLLFFIASSRKEILGRKNCIALFDLFFGRLCVGVALIDTFSSIAAHHCLWLLT